MSADNNNITPPQNPDLLDPQKQQALHKINRARSRLMVCFWTLPIYVVALVLLLNEGRSGTVFMLVYMGVYALFAIDMVIRECPGCRNQFFVKGFFLNCFTRTCMHCGLSCRDSNPPSKPDA
ncbi:MAG: hypothetical protein JKY98_06275 [Gammaproteobacteria bacterium]|nr:hypothetical protein [Gammaproteobacteria bacterium]